MAKKQQDAKFEFEFEETPYKSYGKRNLLDGSSNSKSSNTSRPISERRSGTNKVDNRMKTTKNNKKNQKINRGNAKKNRLSLLIFLPFSFIIKSISNLMKGNKQMANTKSNAKTEVEAPKKEGLARFRGIIGIGLALVVVSIAYSSVVILLGTDGLLPKIMLAPQAIFAVAILLVAFAKVLK